MLPPPPLHLRYHVSLSNKNELMILQTLHGFSWVAFLPVLRMWPVSLTLTVLRIHLSYFWQFSSRLFSWAHARTTFPQSFAGERHHMTELLSLVHQMGILAFFFLLFWDFHKSYIKQQSYHENEKIYIICKFMNFLKQIRESRLQGNWIRMEESLPS